MLSLPRLLLAIPFLFACLAPVACGGQGTQGAAGDDAGSGAHADPSAGGVPLFHRAAPAACDEARGEPSRFYCPIAVGDAGRPCPEEEGSCNYSCNGDQDCTSGPNGRCTCLFGPSAFGTVCSYDQCSSDSDCGNDVCICRETALPSVTADPSRPTFCGPAGNCKVDSDCGAGGYCSPSAAFQCGPGRPDYFGYYCHTPADECTNDSDCAAQGNAFCAYDTGMQRWACSTGMCPDG